MHRTASTIAITLAALACDTFAADLSVRIDGIRTADGHLLLSLAASPDAWNGKAPPAAVRKLPAAAGTAEVVLTGLQPGRYAVQVMHDANDNGELDANLVGMPIEGYGFSNNPQVMRKATFDEAVVDLTLEGADVVIRLN